MKKHPSRWTLAIIPVVIAAVFVAPVLYCLWTDPLTHCPAGLYPGRFAFTEHRYTDSPGEEAALAAVETFNYSLLPVQTAYAASATYVSGNRLNGYATTQAQFNPLAHCGKQEYVYSANVTPCSILNVTLGWDWYPLDWDVYAVGSPLQVKSNGTLLFPSLFSRSMAFWGWSAAYWNGTTYEELHQSKLLNFTDVFLVDMQLSYAYAFGALSAGTELECQEAVVNTSGQVLFVFWLKLMGPVA